MKRITLAAAGPFCRLVSAIPPNFIGCIAYDPAKGITAQSAPLGRRIVEAVKAVQIVKFFLTEGLVPIGGSVRRPLLSSIPH
jgi:hypothetical protein